MKLIGNIIWLLVGGLETAFEYFVAGVALCITIIGIPFGVPGQPGCLSTIMNILWLIAGLPICLTHLFFGIILCITIVGIPFGMQHFKFAGIALTPFGRTVVSDI